MDGLPVEPPVVQVNHGFLRVFFVAELQRTDESLRNEQRVQREHHNANFDAGLMHFYKNVI